MARFQLSRSLDAPHPVFVISEGYALLPWALGGPPPAAIGLAIVGEGEVLAGLVERVTFHMTRTARSQLKQMLDSDVAMAGFHPNAPARLPLPGIQPTGIFDPVWTALLRQGFS